MAKFSYLARNTATGREVKDVGEAPDKEALAASLRAAGMVPVTIREARGPSIFAGLRSAKRSGARGRPKLLDVANFIRQLGTMLSAGIGLVDALDDAATQAEKHSFGLVLQQVRNKVMGGAPLSVALKDHPSTFSSLVSAMIRAGEESGSLEKIMGDLANYLESQIALRRKIRGALTYPIFIGIFFIGACGFLFFFLLPQFQAIFSDLGADLPVITRYTLAASAWMQSWLWLVILQIIAVIILLKLILKTPGGQMAFDKLKIRLPIFGPLALKVVLVRFLETLSTLQRSGVPILMSIDIAGDTAGNKVIEQELQRARGEVMRGSFLSRELGKNVLFPRMMIRMLSVGEETGRIDELLGRAAKFYQDEVEASIQSLTSLIEPVVIVLMGAVVGFVVLSIYLPIFQLAGAMAG